MADMLSQDEIDALLSGADTESGSSDSSESELSSQEMDALGEIGNINMGTSATTLFTLLSQKVTITTPKVEVTSWKKLAEIYSKDYVGVKVQYTVGLEGYNMLVMKDKDVKIITDLMMGGEGNATDEELGELHLSAISEAMNQMIGSSATSMSTMFDKRIDISPPQSFKINFDPQNPQEGFENEDKVVCVSFRMEIGDLIDSEIMQLVPIEFAKDIVKNLIESDKSENNTNETAEEPISDKAVDEIHQPPTANSESLVEDGEYGMSEESSFPKQPQDKKNVNVQPAQFQSFDDGKILIEKKNINMIMDVPLQVTVELGRTSKMIRDILEFGPGSIIELDKLAGEPVDILVNGKIIAKGEVVVIDESFGVRITDIIKPSKRI